MPLILVCSLNTFKRHPSWLFLFACQSYKALTIKNVLYKEKKKNKKSGSEIKR
jgi:hypothetical protein